MAAFDYFGIAHLGRSGLEFGKAGSHDLGDVAFLVALGDGNGFVELVILQSAGHLLNKYAGLLPGGAEHQPTVNHDAHRPSGHD